MADNTRVNELQEKLLQAMDILNAKALDSVSYDKTILCTIENDENKKDGKYEVSDGSIIFTAYSTDERYRNGDIVYVTIPQGNYENQKMIIGKKTSDIEQPFNFVTPFDSFFSMTRNLAATAGSAGLVANDIVDDSKPMEECMTYITLLNKAISDQDLINYTRLGIKADFKSWIKNAVRGNYGLEIILTTEKQGTVEGDVEKGTYIYTLDSSNMYGNPYSFETFYNQELVLDIGDKDIGKVTNIRVDFYQAANFYDQFNEPIPNSLNGFKTETDTNKYVYYPVGDEQGETVENSGYYISLGDKLNDNLFVQNLEIHFGYDISIFTNDYVEIYTADRDSYRRSTSTTTDNSDVNKKNINMRWVHMKDGTPVDMISGEDQSNYEVRWYKYRVGAPATDEYCGIYWIEEKRGDFNLIFNPDVNKQQEKIKAIVLCDGIPYRSNELIFENEEQLPPSEEAQHIMNALNITCDDGTNGNYMIYGQNFDIKDSKYGDEIRTLSAQFDTDNDGKFQDNDIILYEANTETIWTFPNPSRSMINLLNENKREIKDDKDNIIGYTLQNEQPRYNIDKNYASSKNNNTINCIYTLNGVTYTTEKVLNFGVAGTKGTEQTLVVNFANSDTNAIDLNNSARKVYEVIVQLYDASGQPIVDLNNITWSFYKNTHNYLQLNKINNQICELTILNGLEHEQLYILKVEVGDLETYFTIPLKSSNLCDYIDGPTQIIYQANGEPDFYNYPYRLYNDGNEIKEGIYWDIISTDSSDNKSGNYDAIIQNNKLNPIKTYVKDAPLYGVKCYSGSNIVWTQPILVIQNRWSSNVINKWDGKTIEIDNGTGTILSQALAAGTKNSDNEFSGVMIGEWKHTDSNQKTFDQTGVYGFHEGAMSYAFKEDGTAFIGKSSMARINFNGTDATIYSSGYQQEGNAGMMIDLYGNNRRPAIYLKSANGNSTMQLSTEDKGSLIEMKRDAAQFIKITNAENMKPLTIGNKFSVDWNGDINATGGIIGGWNISETQLSSDDGYIVLDTEDYGSIILKSTQSKISGGTITGSTIQAGILASTGKTGVGRIALKGYFQVYSDDGDSTMGRLGYIKANTGNAVVDRYSDGIGIYYGTETNPYSVVKATSANAGLSYSTNYISLNSTGIAMGNGNGSGIIDFSDFSAEQQKGIYARFA